MNYKTLAITAIFLVALLAVPAMATDKFYESKYADPVIEQASPTGILIVDTVAQTTIFSHQINITRVNTTGIPFTSGRLGDASYAAMFKKIAEPITVELKEGHGAQFVDLVPGDFLVELSYGNAGSPEFAVVHINADYPSSVMFQGQAVPVMVQDISCKPVYTIKHATYGGTSQTCHQETVTDSQPWTETIHHPAVTHVVHHAAIPAVPAHCSDNDYHSQNSCEQHHKTWYATIPAVPAWDETVIDHPAYDTYIQHPAQTHEVTVCVPYGNVLDVTSEVQHVVNLGYGNFLFDNAKQPGGIFGISNNLITQIQDPEVGIVKDVIVQYDNGCGKSNTIQTKEYCTMNIVDGVATCPSQTT